MISKELKYKFVHPQAIEGAIRRSHLLEKSLSSPSIRAVFIQGPAGHGKTTLLQQILAAIENQGTAIGWITLDEGDDDPARFLCHLHAAIDSALEQPLGANSAFTESADAGGWFGPVDELLRRITGLQRPIAIFIDEFHVLTSEVIISIMARLLERLPVRATFYIGSRSLPALGLGRLALRNCAVILKTEDLRFTRSETADFFSVDGHTELRSELIDDLFNRTEGWPAALQLARLALQGGADKQIVEVLGFSNEPEFEEYLANNVLSLQSGEIQEFLLKTSILERVTPEICDHLTAGENSENTLRYLEKSGLFIRPLGPQRRWFKFHSLFSTYLRKQLRLRKPAAVQELHGLAMEWFVGHDHPEEAIYHAVESRNFPAAAEILESWSSQLVREARLATMERWLDLLPLEDVRARPFLQIKALWALLFLRRFHRARPLFDDLLKQIEAGNVAYAGTRTLPLLNAVRHLMEDDIVAAGKTLVDIELDRGTFDRFELFELGAIANIQSLYLRTLGRFDEAQGKAELAVAYSAQGDAVFSGAYAMAFSGLTYFAQARLKDALKQYRQGFLAASRMRGSYASAVVAACYAEALYYDDSLDEAKSLLQDALPLISQACMADALAVAHITLAKILNLEGDEVDADYVLREAEQIGNTSGLPRVVKAIKWERIRQLLQRDEVEEARDLADRLISTDPIARHDAHVFHAEELEGDDIGYVRLLIHEGKTHEALRRLPHLIRHAQQSGRVLRRLKLRILEAIALAESDKSYAAKRSVAEVLHWVAPEGFARFLMEESRFVRLIDTFRCSETEVLKKYSDIPPDYVDKIISGTNRFLSSDTNDIRLVYDSLTDREIEILAMLVKGTSNKDIAACLYVSQNTVKYHLRNIYSKLGVRNRTEASNIALRHGIL